VSVNFEPKMQREALEIRSGSATLESKNVELNLSECPNIVTF
jgi:hypothetical protein